MDLYPEARTCGEFFGDSTQQPDSSQRNPFQCYTPPDSAISVTTQSAGGLQTDVVVSGLAASRLASRRPQLTTAQCSRASIEILNPKEEYHKIQSRHSPKGKLSELRISNGQVKVESTLSYYQCMKQRHYFLCILSLPLSYNS